jgi:hypothetical protein
MSLSTKDCIAWIIAEIKNNPSIITSRYVEQKEKDLVIHLASYAQNWKRTFKCGAQSDSEHAKSEYYADVRGATYNRWGDASERYLVDIYSIAQVRGFELKPTQGGIAFIVIEDNNQKLHLGEFLGD